MISWLIILACSVLAGTYAAWADVPPLHSAILFGIGSAGGVGSAGSWINDQLRKQKAR